MERLRPLRGRGVRSANRRYSLRSTAGYELAIPPGCCAKGASSSDEFSRSALGDEHMRPMRRLTGESVGGRIGLVPIQDRPLGIDKAAQ
jgi:hypothetical protein